LQRVTLSGRGTGEANVDLDIPDGYSRNSLNILVVSDGWRDIKVKKSVAWKIEEN
jgi:hypothetical protein